MNVNANWLRHCGRARGFSFVEILFAVIILGIGFIMLAAIFPFAIAQQQAAVSDATATALYRNAESSIRAMYMTPNQLLATGVAPPPPAIAPHDTTGLAALADSRLYVSDPRFAWTAIYSRDNSAPDLPALVYIVALQATNAQEYTSNAFLAYSLNFQPIDIVSLDYDVVGSKITISPTGYNGNAAEGACLVVSATAANTQTSVGKMYRLGEPVDPNATNPMEWYVSAETPVSATDDFSGGTNTGWLIGRSLADPNAVFNASTNPYRGASQVIGFKRVEIPYP